MGYRFDGNKLPTLNRHILYRMLPAACHDRLVPCLSAHKSTVSVGNHSSPPSCQVAQWKIDLNLAQRAGVKSFHLLYIFTSSYFQLLFTSSCQTRFYITTCFIVFEYFLPASKCGDRVQQHIAEFKYVWAMEKRKWSLRQSRLDEIESLITELNERKLNWLS